MPTQKSFLPSAALIKIFGWLPKIVLGFVLVAMPGYIAIMALNPKARAWATKDGGPTPFKVVNQILAIPAQIVGKTSHASATDPDRFARPAESPAITRSAILALAEKNAATTATHSSPPPQASRPTPQAPAPDTPDQMKLAGDIIIAQASPAGSPRASAAFFYWIVKLNVGGVTQGKPSRVLLNNRLIYEGDEVNRTLGIIFARLDPEKKLLIFRDQTGATVTRSY